MAAEARITTWEGLDALRGLLEKHYDPQSPVPTRPLYYITINEKEATRDERVARIDVRREDGKGRVTEMMGNHQPEAIETLIREVCNRIERSAVGLAIGRYKVGLYAKGSDYLESTTVVIVPADPVRERSPGGESAGLSDLFEMPGSTVPPITAPEGPVAQSFNILAAGYGTFFEQIALPFLQRAMRMLEQHQGAVLGPLTRQMERIQGQNEQYAREIMAIRKAEIEGAHKAVLTEAEAKARAEVMTTGITEASSLARAYYAMKQGIDPRLVDLLAVVGDDPELMRTLADPTVRVMLADAENRKQLRELLAGAAAEAATAGAADETPPPQAAELPPLPSETT